MKPSTKDEIKGSFHEVKGKVKEKIELLWEDGMYSLFHPRG
jgi:hypothetical protein